ncbi:ABC-3 protein [Methanothermus fervidus DSM 2088]|uniref:ABC-3 protein n=1 Tax=Methanothermus fervidus (strain ATCC 43054 / DSM 2088 / JCM 10308 / V24 S) TaxID=523846 RepID=E3GYH1_METFV|nr:metal ABC transporter permease [Methanothermus fervidus]ADP77353.1 ABC-3 protein [Methanothermus fervidus DSM 2088]
MMIFLDLFKMFSYDFMRQALLIGTIGGFTCGMLGVMVVGMGLSLIGITIAHAAFLGSVIAFFIGINPLIGAIVCSIIVSAIIGPLSDKRELNPDTVMGFVVAIAHGLAFLLMGLMVSAKTEALNLMWGNAIGMDINALMIVIASFILVVGSTSLFYKEFQAIIFDREIALSVGLPACLIYYGIIFLIGLTVTANLESIGGLLVSTLIICPAAAAYQVTHNLKHLFCVAGFFWRIILFFRNYIFLSSKHSMWSSNSTYIGHNIFYN